MVVESAESQLCARAGRSWGSLCTPVPLSGVGSPSLEPPVPELTAPAAVFQDKHVEEVRKNKEGKDPGEAETD